jgi:ectoine hydroxylase-related dioxygenase (phytanoyl-CoA dioxygenase family)
MSSPLAAPVQPTDAQPTLTLAPRPIEGSARARNYQIPPVTTRFKLGNEITDEQRAFLDAYGFLVFERVATQGEVDTILEEADRIGRQWVSEGRESVYGIPLFVGRGLDGGDFVQRLPFTSMFSEPIRRFVRDARFEPVRTLIGADARVGDQEKDGVVMNRYVNIPGSVHPRLGWHTDGLRDVFYGRRPRRMLNVGLHFDRVTSRDGGLRILPGTHEQSMWKTVTHKLYFVSHAPDPLEICVETEPGDLTVHDGRAWHRVAQSPNIGASSVRRSMYVPYLTDAYQPKSEDSSTPAYHHLFAWWRKLKRARA